MAKCQYIGKCGYAHKEYDPVCKSEVISPHCGIYQNFKAEDVVKVSGLEKKLSKS